MGSEGGAFALNHLRADGESILCRGALGSVGCGLAAEGDAVFIWPGPGGLEALGVSMVPATLVQLLFFWKIPERCVGLGLSSCELRGALEGGEGTLVL